jgi:phage terminase small subunit
MKNGRPPKPTVLHRLHGTYHATRHRERADPVAPGELGKPPSWLSRDQARRFHQLSKQAPRRLLRQADSGMLASYVIVEGLVAEANKARQEQRGEADAHLRTLRSFLPMLRQFASELGLSPSGRASVRGAVEPEVDDADAWRWRAFDQISNRRNVRELMATRIIGSVEESEEVSDADEGPEVQATVEGEVEDGAAEAVVEVPSGVPPEAISE